MQKTSKTRILVECALMIALAVVLDILPLPKWPNGGSVSVSMVPIVFLSYRHGTKWGLLTGFTYCIIQMITGFYAPPAGTILAFTLCILLDYVIAFTVLGAADRAEWQRRVDAILALSLYDTGVAPEYGDELLTLSTCGETSAATDRRFAVLAVRIETGGRE